MFDEYLRNRFPYDKLPGYPHAGHERFPEELQEQSRRNRQVRDI